MYETWTAAELDISLESDLKCLSMLLGGVLSNTVLPSGKIINAKKPHHVLVPFKYADKLWFAEISKASYDYMKLENFEPPPRFRYRKQFQENWKAVIVKKKESWIRRFIKSIRKKIPIK